MENIGCQINSNMWPVGPVAACQHPCQSQPGRQQWRHQDLPVRPWLALPRMDQIPLESALRGAYLQECSATACTIRKKPFPILHVKLLLHV